MATKFVHVFDDVVAETAGAHGAGAVGAWARVEAAACARRVFAMVAMLDTAYAASGSADRDRWCMDNWAAVCAQIGAAQRLTSGVASGYLLVGTALRERYREISALFTDGVIDYPLVRTIVARGLLVTDPAAQAALDAALAAEIRTWGPMSAERTERFIDAAIARVDPRAVRRTQTSARSRSMDVHVDDAGGLATVYGTMFAAAGVALSARLDGLADTVCGADPRTRDQCRADAMGALSQGADRLACRCNTDDCPAALNPPSTGVIIHLIAHPDTLQPPPAAEPEPTPPRPPETDGPAGDVGEDRGPDEAEPSGDAAEDAGDTPPAAEAPPPRIAVTVSPEQECAALDGVPPPMFSKPLREMTWAELVTDDDPGQFSQLRPGALMGGQLLPGALIRRAAPGATIQVIVHPGQAPPEPRYTPSKALADFVRCRDLTCRFPGCHTPATHCDLDHTIAWPSGPTSASNLKCLCRKHHLLKTFWGGATGWRDRQSPEGTIVWTAPDGRTHTTTPGSRLLFPELCDPTAPVAATTAPPPAHTAGLTMPRRRRTRTQDRAHHIDDERRRHQLPRDNPGNPREDAYFASRPLPPQDDNPPPF